MFFVNKIDRLGARFAELLDEMTAQLPVRPIAMMDIVDAGSRGAKAHLRDMMQEPFLSSLCEALAVDDEMLLNNYVLAPDRLSADRLKVALADQVARGTLNPAFCGIAMTGVGVPELISAVEALLPAKRHDIRGPLKGRIFKI